MHKQAAEVLNAYLNSYLILSALVGGIVGVVSYVQGSIFLSGVAVGIGAFVLLFFMDLTRVNYTDSKKDEDQ